MKYISILLVNEKYAKYLKIDNYDILYFKTEHFN